MNDGEPIGRGQESYLLTYSTPATFESGRSFKLPAGTSVTGRTNERRLDPRPFTWRGQKVLISRKAMEDQGPRDLYYMMNPRRRSR